MRAVASASDAAGGSGRLNSSLIRKLAAPPSDPPSSRWGIGAAPPQLETAEAQEKAWLKGPRTFC